MARVVLDAGAVAELAHHLEIEGGSLAQPSRFECPALGFELADPLLHLGLDVDDGLLELVSRGHVVGGRVDVDLLALGQELAGQWVQLGDALDFIAEELDADEGLLRSRLELEGVAPHPEPCAGEGLVVALVLQIHEVAQDGVPAVLATDPEPQHGRAIVHRGAESVDAGHGGHDDDVSALEQGMRRGVPKPVDLVVPARVLLDVRIGPREIGLGLVVVEVADEVLDRIVGKEFAELGIELGRERLVVGEDEGRPIDLGDRPGEGRGLARARGTQQRLVVQAAAQPVDESLDGLRLVPGGFEGGDELQIRHA